ncbi:excinuclease ABC subunit C [bacterium]|nr:excinuclease ABC subunit C [bacterium]
MIPSETLTRLLKTLPEKPGVYHHLDKEGKILYIGKAKNLKKRVSSYFSKSHETARIGLMVKKIADIKTIVTETEYEALLLENTLIKQHQPRYNVSLKDDKTYPWIVIKKEPFPRIFYTRKKINDGSEYFGPYASVRSMKAVLELIRQIHPLRTCTLALKEESIAAGRFQKCLEYHLGNCLGPCEGLQSRAEYEHEIALARALIGGRLGQVKKRLHERMLAEAEALRFEEAQRLKQRIEWLERYQAKSTVVSNTLDELDVFSALIDAQFGYINYLKVIDGAVVHSHTTEYRRKLDESAEELLGLSIAEIRGLFRSQSKEVLVSHALELPLEGVWIHQPLRGEKKALIELSLKNARSFRVEKLKNIQIVDPERHVRRIMEQMKVDLRLTEEPRHIECFDNSNTQGSDPVSACVVFRDGKPSKSEYRHFNVRDIEGPDDFASMEQAVFRRYDRLIKEGAALPQLVVVDGGKGQLSAALKSFDALGIRGKVALLGIAKRLEELYFPNDPIPLYLDKRSETLRVIQQMRDEAHRFGLTHHRKRRSKTSLGTTLEGIEGVGIKTIERLLAHFKSAKKAEAASLAELEEVLGKSKAQLVHAYFHGDVDAT